MPIHSLKYMLKNILRSSLNEIRRFKQKRMLWQAIFSETGTGISKLI